MAKISVSFSSRLALMLASPTANGSVSFSSGLASMLALVSWRIAYTVCPNAC